MSIIAFLVESALTASKFAVAIHLRVFSLNLLWAMPGKNLKQNDIGFDKGQKFHLFM